MSEAIKSMDNSQLRELISTLARCAAPWSVERIGDGIDLAAAELLRRAQLPKVAKAPRP